MALFTGVSLLIQLVPVAPPRLLPGTGLVDTADALRPVGLFLARRLQRGRVLGHAVGARRVALLVAIAVITVSRSRWRWLATAYPMLTLLVVVVTANHFWLDGIVAGLLVILVLLVQWTARRLRSGQAREEPQVKPVRGEMSVRS